MARADQEIRAPYFQGAEIAVIKRFHLFERPSNVWRH